MTFISFNQHGFMTGRRPRGGFTLIEILIAVAILAVIAAFTFITLLNFGHQRALESDATTVAIYLQEAWLFTQASHDGRQYGVDLSETDQITLFQGAEPGEGQAVKTHRFNRQVEIAQVALAGGRSFAVFERLTGATEDYGTVTVSIKNESELNREISLSEWGVVEIE